MTDEKPTAAQQMMATMLKKIVGEDTFAQLFTTIKIVCDGVVEMNATQKKILMAIEDLSDRIGRLEKAKGIPPMDEATEGKTL